MIPGGGQVVVVSQAPQAILLEYFDLDQCKVRTTDSIQLAGGEFAIESLLGHSDGNVYVGGYMGGGLASVNPETEARWDSPNDENVINQIEGMIEFNAGRLYIGSHGSADLISVDSTRKDDAAAYQRLLRLSTEDHQSRPFG